jgi:hypothetical protein
MVVLKKIVAALSPSQLTILFHASHSISFTLILTLQRTRLLVIIPSTLIMSKIRDLRIRPRTAKIMNLVGMSNEEPMDVETNLPSPPSTQNMPSTSEQNLPYQQFLDDKEDQIEQPEVNFTSSDPSTSFISNTSGHSINESFDDSDEDPDYQQEECEDRDESSESSCNSSAAGDETPPITNWGPVSSTSHISFVEYENSDKFLRNDISIENPSDIYRMFLSDEILNFMVTETNRYAQQQISIGKSLKWIDISKDEMERFLAILMLMGIHRLPEIRLYWSNNEMFANALIKKTMSRDRFVSILNNWHFSNNEDNLNNDRLWKIQKLVDMFLTNFKTAIAPGKEVVIDESMVPWRGRLLFRQYIPQKTHKYGIKLYKLCLPSGYTYNLSIYAGKTSESTANIGHAHRITMNLMEGLLDEGRILFGDNFYSSLPLIEELMDRKTFYCGTLRKNRRGLPQDFLKKKQKKGEIDCLENRNGVKIMKWTDKRQVLMLSSCIEHNGDMVETRGKNRFGNVVHKPDSVISYNNAKKGVDLSDQLASYYTNLRKTIKWYRKIAMEIIFGTAIVNAWTVQRSFSSGRIISLLEFRTAIIRNLLASSEEIIPNPVRVSRKQMKAIHKLEKADGQVRAVRKRCRNCYKKLYEEKGKKYADSKTRRVATFCLHCPDKPHLCMTCFNEIHN